MVDHFRPGAAANACSTVELSVSCRGLADLDVFSKSDPMVVLFIKEFGRDKWFEFGRTETIWNNLNPEFAKKFVMNYFFEERQYLRFEVYDVDSASPDLRKHDFIGRLDVTLGEIVSVSRLEKRLTGGSAQNPGTIIVVASEEIAGCKEEATLHFEGKKLDKKDFFGKSDPYLAFYKVNEDNTYTVVHRTEVIKNTLNPTWKPFTIPVRTLCGGDYSRSILVRCYDWNRNGTEDLIGEFVTNLQALSQAANGQNVFFELINPKYKQKKANYKNSGTVILSKMNIKPILTFLDYVQAGTQLNCTIAVDFTASNGDPTKPGTLHYIHPYIPNQYQRALLAVGEIIQDYDTDKLFPVLGFGARLPPDGRVSHEFFVNGNPSNPFCQGIEGVMASYQRCLMSVQLYGPTNFANVVNHVARFAAAKRDGSEYFILLIITDGVITDMPQTKDAIVNAASLPLSIIIVGVGDADFEAMRELDGDTVRLSSNGRVAERDIVQFVPFREFIKNQSGDDMQMADYQKAQLAKEVLAEIPEQFMSYMKKNNIAPGQWRNATGGPSRPAQAAPMAAPIPPKSGMFAPPNASAGPGFPTSTAPYGQPAMPTGFAPVNNFQPQQQQQYGMPVAQPYQSPPPPPQYYQKASSPPPAYDQIR